MCISGLIGLIKYYPGHTGSYLMNEKEYFHTFYLQLHMDNMIHLWLLPTLSSLGPHFGTLKFIAHRMLKFTTINYTFIINFRRNNMS